MSDKKLRTKTVRKTKLWSDFGNHVSKPLGVLLMVGYPYAAIVFYSMSLYFSIQHNRAHLKRIEAKAKRQGKTLNLSMKAWTMFARLGFDVLGLGLSIVLLGLNIWFATLIPDSLVQSLLLVASIGMTASSVASTFHKVRRLGKDDYDWTWGDVGRAAFGLAGTVFLGCVLFGVIPAALLSNPLFLIGGAVLLGVMGLFKMKNAVDAGRETSRLLEGLNSAPRMNLGEFIKVSKKNLAELRELGYADLEVLLEQVTDDIKELTDENKNDAKKYLTQIEDFYQEFNIIFTPKMRQQMIGEMPSPPSSPRMTIKYTGLSIAQHPLIDDYATQTDTPQLSPSLRSESSLRSE